MKKSKCIIFPSRWYETMGLTVLEGLSNNLPAIVSNKSAASDYIVNNKNGILFDGTLNSLKKCIKNINNINFTNVVDLNLFNKENYINELFKLMEKIIL